MGAKDSKPSCISYEDAVKRITDSEHHRIRDAFKRCTYNSSGPNTNSSLGPTYLSRQDFIQYVLGEGCPQAVAEVLFIACGGGSRGIAFKELLCGLVLLTKGTFEERIKFLWSLYCNESGTYILKQDFLKSIQTEFLHQPSTPFLDAFSLLEFNQLFNNGNDRATQEQFRNWIDIHRNATVLSKWLLIECCVSLSSEVETPTFYQSLAGVTHLEEQDICELEKAFWGLTNSSSSGQLDLEVLMPLMNLPILRKAVPGLILAFDENRDGHIDFKELCCGVSAACRGPIVERTKFCFKIFDTDRDGNLSEAELKNMLEILVNIANDNRSHQMDIKETVSMALDEIKSSIKSYKNTTSNFCDTTKMCNEQLNNDLNKNSTDFSLSQEQFLMWSVETTSNLVQPFLHLLFEVCHIVLGLRPQCCHQEHEIVSGWLQREVSRGYEVGQFWYLISSEWWSHWRSYTGGQCHCRSSGSRTIYPMSVDEAVICDESFTSNSTESMGEMCNDNTSLASGSSGISSSTSGTINGSSTTSSTNTRKKRGPPGPIDNTSLIAPALYKVQTLTREGGRLKRDTTLSQHRDFELVPDSLWKALALWHRGPMPLPRQVIHPQDSSHVELELYPLNLRILRHQCQQGFAVPSVQSWGGLIGGYGALSGGYVNAQNSLNSSNFVPQPPKRYLAYTAAFSRLATVKQVCEFLCKRLQLRTDCVRLWHILGNTGSVEVPCLLEDEQLSLEALQICDDDQILIEIRNKDLTWPEELGALALAQRSSSGSGNAQSYCAMSKAEHPPGATGLHNLGNTCFMNAALQAIFNTKPLTQYFRHDLHMYELNSVNPLGTRGRIACRYGELCKEVWRSDSGRTRSIAPLRLRWTVTKHAPRFAGGGQHDSQELLEWLLDALHEDLNRVTDKPYRELKDSDGRADCEVAAEAWAHHLERNRSIIVDLFYGQLKSKVTCQCCGHESVRFDPFSLLSLPLPLESYVHCQVLVILLNGTIPIKYGLRLNSESKYKDLKENLSKLCNIKPLCLLITELADSQIKHIMCDDSKIKQSSALELVAYELPESSDCDQYPEIRKQYHTFGDIQRDAEISAKSKSKSSSVSSTITMSESIDTQSCIDVKPASKQKYDFNKICENSLINLMQTAEVDSNGTVRNVNYCHTQDLKSTNYVQNEDKQEYRRPSYIVALHRKGIRQDTYFLSHQKAKTNLFGVPLLIPFSMGLTNKQLYCAVWAQVSRLLSPLPPTPPEQANHAMDCDDSLGYEYPFSLSVVAPGGRICAICPWYRFCRGCEIRCTDEPLLYGILQNHSMHNGVDHIEVDNQNPNKLVNGENFKQNINYSESMCESLENNDVKCNVKFLTDEDMLHISIDWDPTALHLRYQTTREKVWKDHESIAICQRKQIEPIDLDHCLKAFTTEEKLEEKYHCSKCQCLQPATKKLQIWRLPPVLIIHLKRFNYLHNKWVKSQKVVSFPVDFDPTAYLASVPQETILRQKELKEMHNIIEEDNQDCNESTDITNEALTNNDNKATNVNGDTKKDRKSGRKSFSIKTRERLVSSSLTKTPIVDGDFEDFHQHHLDPDADVFDLKYQLYAVVSHSGMLNGGHYVSYASNPNGNWYCYNDSSCREVTKDSNGSIPALDLGSAYMLFYERKGLNYMPYFPEVCNGMLSKDVDADLDETDIEFKKVCTLS